jgi:maleate isomerase
MPSLASIEPMEARYGIPVVSSAACTVFQMLEALGLPAMAPGAGSLLSGRYGRVG